MTQTFQQLETQISQILKENHQLKKELDKQEKRPIIETRKLLLNVIEELDELERDEKHEMSGVSPENRIFSIPRDIYNTAKKPLLKILKRHKVVEMREEMYYNQPDYVDILEQESDEVINNRPKQIIRKGYFYKGELFRKGMLG